MGVESLDLTVHANTHTHTPTEFQQHLLDTLHHITYRRHAMKKCVDTPLLSVTMNHTTVVVNIIHNM